MYHVATSGSDSADGSAGEPLRTINAAAALAQPGDTVRVHEGGYREWATPVRGGLSDRRRITHEAAEGERVVLKGSERITEWTPVEGAVWRAVVPNALFGSFNPFAEEVDGDWLVHPPSGGWRNHLGYVYLNGRSFYEVHDVAAVHAAPARSEGAGLEGGETSGHSARPAVGVRRRARASIPPPEQ